MADEDSAMLDADKGAGAAKPQHDPLKLVLPKDFTHQQLLEAISGDFAARLKGAFGASNTANITAQKHDQMP